MKTCKICGREIKESVFDEFFTAEALEKMPCCTECKDEQIEKQRQANKTKEAE